MTYGIHNFVANRKY